MSRYHEGERIVQERAGVSDMAERVGRGIHASIPPAAQAFVRGLPMAILAAVDGRGRVWTSVVTGEPGFMRADDDLTLTIGARLPARDPLSEALRDGAHVGVLVIELASRRRFRLNGRVTATLPQGIRIRAEEVFANCPKYIQARSWRRSAAGSAQAEPPVLRGVVLTSEQQDWVRQADTFFIGSRHAAAGADASHRGGPPGFVRVTEGRRLAWGDYAGNKMFQTLGNITADSRAGLLFLDFARGRTLQLTGRARVDWDPAHAATFPGAERVVEFELGEAIEVQGTLPLDWSPADRSPFNPATV